MILKVDSRVSAKLFKQMVNFSPWQYVNRSLAFMLLISGFPDNLYVHVHNVCNVK